MEVCLTGDILWVAGRLRPLLWLLAPNSVPLLETARTESDLIDLLNSSGACVLPTAELLALCRSASGDLEFGRELHRRCGERFQLGRWNQALLALGPPHQVLRCEAVVDDFDTHRLTLRTPIRAIGRAMARDDAGLRYVEIRDALDVMRCPEEWELERWGIEFSDVTHLFADRLEQFGRVSLIVALRAARSLHTLSEALRDVGIDPELDPAEIHARNSAGIKAVADQLRRLGLFWCVQQEIEPGPWEIDSDSYEAFAVHLDTQGYLDIWSAPECERLVRGHAPRAKAHQRFWEIVDQSRDLQDLTARLAPNPSDLGAVEERLKELRERERRRARMVEVCGSPFDSDRENLEHLWGHIDAHTQTAPTADLSSLTVLQPLRCRSDAGREKQRSGGGGGGNRLSQRTRDLIGLAGEIHVYRALQAQYGNGVVGPANWVSSNSLFRFAGNVADDGLGYDLQLTVERRRWLIEVKATASDSEMIEMGQSQVQTAMTCAHKRSTRYVIARVLNALSDQPKIEFLPNPYHPSSAPFYDFRNAGMRLTYRRSGLR